MMMSFTEALNRLCTKYEKYGFEREFLSEQLRNGIMEYGFSVTVAYNALRMSLAQETGEHELFSIDDVVEATGESKEWVVSQIEQCKAELIAEGKNPDDYFPVSEPEPKKTVFYFPHGLTS